MLTLILGRFGSGKTTQISQMINDLVRQGTPAFLVVPEQATVATERLFADILPPSAPLSFEVTNFSRLANTLFRRAGGLACHPIGKDGHALLMWQALHECKAALSSPVDETVPENILRYLSAANELSADGIDEEALQTVLPALSPSHSLYDKINDFLLVSSAYHALIAQKDPASSGDDLTRLASLLEKSPLLADTPVFLDDFVSFTATEMRILRAILPTTDVTVSLAVPPIANPSISYDEVKNTAHLLTETAKKLNLPFRVKECKETYRPAHPVFHYIADALFSPSQTPSYEEMTTEIYGAEPTRTPKIEIKAVKSVFDEANQIAADICRLVQNGARYRDILVVGRNPESYRGILDETLRRNGIPFFFAEKTDLTAYEPIKLILSAYRMRLFNYQTVDVISYLKCGFSGIDRNDCDALEIYMTKWKLRGSSLMDDKDWKFHPRGYTSQEKKPFESELLERLNRAKKTLSSPFETFGGAPCVKKIKQHATSLVLFLEELNVAASLQLEAERALRRGDRRLYSDYRALYPCICRVLDCIVNLMGDIAIHEKEFFSLLSLALSCQNIGSIPSAVDEVMIGDAGMIRPSSPVHTIIFGANDGVFPGVADNNGFFNLGEKRTLRELGLSFSEEPYFASARERYAFLRAFLSPTGTLTITVPLASSGLASLRPSPLLKEIKRVGGHFVSVRSADDFELSDLLWRKESLLDLFGLSKSDEEKEFLLRHINDDPILKQKAAALSLPLVNPQCRITQKKDKTAPLSLTQSRMDNFLRCPFSYTCQYILKLNENADADFRYAESGTFIHALLETFFRRLTQEGRKLNEMSDGERMALLEQTASACEQTLLSDHRMISKRFSHMCHRLKNSIIPLLDSLGREFADSDFVPRFFELSIGGKGGIASPALTLSDGTPLSLYGTIDRVDTCKINDQAYIRVVDYKTGNKKFDKEKDLQLMLYLHALTQSKDPAFRKSACFSQDESIKPAAVFYLMTGQKSAPIANASYINDAREEAKNFIERSGVLLNNPAVLDAMSHDYGSEFFGLKESSKGLSAGKSLSLVSEEFFEESFSTMRENIIAVGERIHGGEAHALPLRTSSGKSDVCATCAFKAVCRSTTFTQKSSEDSEN